MLGQKMLMKMECKKTSKKGSVLVVDDYTQLGRLMKRMLSSSFDKVFTASHPNEAIKILESHEITHLLCDLYLGIGNEQVGVTGYTFVEFWRRRFPGIERAVVFTGADLAQLEKPDAVDAVISKSEGVERVIDTLLDRKTR